MKRTRIKMCGTTLVADARKAAQLGVDAVGFIFVEKSPRYITPEHAARIASELPPFVDKVGVFVNSGRENIEEIVRYVGLTAVQLHGDETPEFCATIAASIPTCFVLKALRVGEHTKSDEIARYNDCVSGFVLDTYIKGVAGGTGKVFDWSLIPRLKITKPYLLAGGLTPENILSALTEVSPYGVDINSGVEVALGEKSHQLLEELIGYVRQSDLR